MTQPSTSTLTTGSSGTARPADRPAAVRPTVLRSARAFAASHLRKRRFLAPAVLAVLAPIGAVVPQQLVASYRVADAVTNAWVWYLGLCLVALPVVIAATIAGQNERGMRRQRVLDGEPELLQTAAAAVGFAAIASVGAILVIALESAIAGIQNAVSPSKDYASAFDVSGKLTQWALTLVMVVSVGLLAAALAHRASQAAVLSALVSALGAVLGAAEVLFPSLRYVVAALPRGVLTLIGSQDSGKETPGQVDVAAVAAFVWPLAAIAVVIWAAVRAPRTQLSAGRGRSGAARRRALLPASAVLVALGLVAAGAVVPVSLRDRLPWQYRPIWLADKAAHRSSVDVTKEFLDDVAHGRAEAAGRLTKSGDATTLLGPYQQAAQQGAMTVLPLLDTQRLEPGSVPVQVPGNQITMCLTRSAGRWIIIDLNTNGSCPAASSR